MHDFLHFSFSAPLGLPVDASADLLSPEAMRVLLADAHRRRVHSQCLVWSAVSARSDLAEFPLSAQLRPSWLETCKDANSSDYAQLLHAHERRASERSGPLEGGPLRIDPRAFTHDQSTFDALLKLLQEYASELAVTNEALSELATSTAKELVGQPGRLVPGVALADMLQISEEAVRQRHQAGKLIAILQSGRERGRGFPVFQAWAGVAGAPLEQILGALGYRGPAASTGGNGVDAADVYQFFIGRNEMLGGFTPVEALTGAGVHDASDTEAAEFLAQAHADRLALVMGVARSEAGLCAA